MDQGSVNRLSPVRTVNNCHRASLKIMLLAGHLHLGLSIQLVLCCVLIDSVQSLRDYLLDSISASMHAIDCVKRVQLMMTKLGVHILPMAFPWT